MLGIGFKVSDAPPASLQRPLRAFLARGFAVAPSAASASISSSSSPSATPADDHANADAANADGHTNADADDALQRALDAFAQLKRDVDLVRAPSAMARRVLLRYYAQLERMAARFDGLDTALDVPFTWNDSFCPRKRATAGAAPLRFEMAAVLFNYGALESQLGVQTDRADADGLKAACRHFMLAAGAFATVRDELVGKFLASASSSSPDMSHEGLSMLTSLMLAQAQACFYEKASKDQMKDAIKAKLVHQAAEYYGAALDMCESAALKGVIDRMWGVHVRFQLRCMQAATQFWQAKAAKEAALARGTGYGEEIARLQAADAVCGDALKFGAQNKLPASIAEVARALQKVVAETLHAAVKDNASIYLENVPKLAELPPVGKASMVRPLALTPDELAAELLGGGSGADGGGGDLFEKFVPQHALQRAARAKDDVRARLEAARARVAASNDAVKQTLHALGLPAAIEAFEHTADDGIPPGVWRRVQHVQQRQQTHGGSGGGLNAVENMQQQLGANDAASERVERQLRAIESRLSAEEIEDNVCRQNYGAARWARPASAALSDGFRLDVDRYYRLVKEAKESDKVVATKLAGARALLELLTKTKPELDAQLPRLATDTSSCRDEIAAVSKLLLQLTALMDEKDQVLRDFAASYDKFDVLPILVRGPAAATTATANASATTTEVDHALANELRFFETHFVAKLDAVCADETATLDALATANAQFEAKKASDHVLLERQAVLQRIGDAIDTLEQLQSHLKEGAKFYEELATRIAQLQQTVEDHCAARDLERRDMELHVQADDAQRKREARDAAVAAQMMRDMQLRDDATHASRTTAHAAAATATSDEEFARQLAGSVQQLFPSATASAPTPTHPSASFSSSHLYGAYPQHHQHHQHHQQPPPPPTPSYDYSHLQQHQPPPPPPPPAAPHHPYTAYHQQQQQQSAPSTSGPPPAYSSIFSSSPSSTPQFGNYYYAQQQHQQHQQPPYANGGYHQYSAGAAYAQGGPAPSHQGASSSSSSTSPFRRPPGGSV